MQPNYALNLSDCVDGMRAMPEHSVDLVVTSPPYNIGIAYATYDDRAAREDYLDWCAKWLREVQRVLKADGSFFLNVGASPKDPLLPHQIALVATNLGLKLQNTFHWIKSITVPVDSDLSHPDGLVSVGHFKPINSARFVTDCHEYIFHFTLEGDVPLNRLALGVPYQHKSNIARWGHTGGRDCRCRGNNWFIPYETIQSRAKERPHPASFPRQLVRNCLLITDTGAESHVMDPFLGIGTSAIACAEHGVGRFTGFDIDAGYLKVARERLAALQRPMAQDQAAG